MIRKTQCDSKLVDELLEIGKEYEKNSGINVISGKTLCAHDFYEG